MSVPFGTPKITRVSADALEHVLEERFRFIQYDVRSHAWVPKDVPVRLVRRLLATAATRSEIPELAGIVQVPTLRPDGTVLDQPGYDPGTGLLFYPDDVEFPPMLESPTWEDAVAESTKWTDLLAGFPFVDHASQSAALSMFFTPLVRHACRTVPLHGVTAPQKGTGKSMLARMVGHLVIGHAPSMLSQADSAAEDQKRILGVLMEGRPLAVIDNIERPLKSDTLCTVLTEERYSGRLLGRNEIIDVPCKATFFATGNNLVLAGDLTRRAVVCALDAKCERPEERHFDVDLYKEILKRRAELVVAVLTIVRAYLAAGSPKPDVPNFAGFEDWCWFVRYPLIWLGMADPCAGRERIEAHDPVREQLVALLTAWYELFGSTPWKVGDAINEATREAKPGEPEADIQARKALHEAMTEVGGHSRNLATVIGQFIHRHADRIEGGLRFEKARKGKGGAFLWRVAPIADHSHDPAKGEVGEVGEVVPHVTDGVSPKKKIIKKGPHAKKDP